MADKKSFVVYKSWKSLFNELPPEQAGVLIQAVFSYQDGEDVSISDPVLAAVFNLIRNQMDADNEKYMQTVNRRKEAGAKGGVAKAGKSKQKVANAKFAKQNVANVAVNDNDNDNEYVNDNDYVNVSSNEDITPLSSDEDNSSAKPTREHVPYQEVVEKFNEICLSLPQVQKLTPARRQAIKGRCSEYSVPEIVDVFRRAENSDFLSGRNGNWNGCSFDWLMKPSNFIKVLEGNYENQPVINQHSKINGHDELNEFYAMTARWAEGDNSG